MISDQQFEKELDLIISNGIREDVGEGDYSSLACIPAAANGKAKLLVKEKGIIAGVQFAKRILNYVDETLKIEILINDGDAVNYGDIVFYVSGNSRSILKAERLLLNAMQRMSAIATKTRKFADLLKVGRSTLWRFHSAGKIPPPVRIGGSTRWRAKEIEEWVDAGCPARAH